MLHCKCSSQPPRAWIPNYNTPSGDHLHNFIKIHPIVPEIFQSKQRPTARLLAWLQIAWEDFLEFEGTVLLTINNHENRAEVIFTVCTTNFQWPLTIIINSTLLLLSQKTYLALTRFWNSHQLSLAVLIIDSWEGSYRGTQILWSDVVLWCTGLGRI